MKTHDFLMRAAALFEVAFTLPAPAAPLKIELPAETATFKAGPSAELASTHCLICHSAEYVSTQPPLTQPAWTATVEKMQKKFGAPLPADQVAALVDYIVKSYGAAPAKPETTAPGM